MPKERWTILQQINYVLKKKTRYGESKKEANIKGYKDKYIYSYGTYETYQKAMEQFANYCKDKYGINSVKSMEKYVPEYIEYRIKNNISSHTIKMERSAFAKFYGHDFNDIFTPKRSYATVTRGRGVSKRSQRFSVKNNQDVIIFCKNVGVRKKELKCLVKEADTLTYDEFGNPCVNLVKGTKGGRPRKAIILNADEKVIEMIKNAPEGEKMFPKKYDSLNEHKIRAQYAVHLYESIMKEMNIDLDKLTFSEKYYCRKEYKGEVYSKKVLAIVSKSLGHNRLGVVMWYFHACYDDENKDE